MDNIIGFNCAHLMHGDESLTLVKCVVIRLMHGDESLTLVKFVVIRLSNKATWLSIITNTVERDHIPANSVAKLCRVLEA